MQKIYKECKVRISLWSKLVLMVVGIGAAGSSWGQMAGDFRPRSATGNWSDFNAWDRHNGTTFVAATAGQIPTATSDIFFVATRNISVDITTAVCNNIRLSVPGTSERITLNAGGILSIYGSLIQNANSNVPFTGFGLGSKIIFTGTANQTITNSGANTRLGNVEINKSSGTFTLPGVNTRYDIFTLTSGAVVGASGAVLLGLSTASTVNVNGGTWTQIVGANRINGGASGDDIALTINGGTMTLATTSGTGAGYNFSSITIINGGVLNMNTGIGGNFNVTNTFSIDATSTVNSTFATTPSATTNNFLGTFNYNAAGNQSIINTTYGNLGLLVSGTKTPPATLNITRNLTISGSPILPLSATIGVNIGGNWTSYGQGGLTESTSTVTFNGAGAQIINTTGGEDFYLVRKSGAGTLTLNSNVSATGGAGSGLNISAGIVDAGTFTLSGAGTSTLTMTSGILRLGKLNTILPEFTGTYALSGGTVELNGVGTQSFRGGENYANITFSNSGTKTLTGSINPPTNNITGTITVANTTIFDATNLTMGGPGTNITMTGTSTYRTAGTATKPDAQGTYTLGAGTTIEFSNTAGTATDIRLTPNYYNIIISGNAANYSLTSTPLSIQTGGSFTVTSSGTFKHYNVNGFSGAANTTISTTNNPTITLAAGSTIDYFRTDGASQNISNATNVGLGASHYSNLTLSGSGNKIAPATTLEIRGNLTGAGTAAFVHSNGTVLFNGTAGQTYSSSTEFPFYNLTNNSTLAGGGFRVNSNLSVEKELRLNTLSSILLNTGDVALKSSSTNTANVAAVPNEVNIIQYPGVGRFNVERYLSAYKSWRFLATPVQSLASGDATAASINDTWREGGSSLASTGFGTRITGTGTLGLPAGLDENTPFPSMKYYNMATNNYIGITSADLAANRTIANNEGYYVFVRGDRAEDIYSVGTSTNLRTKGKLRTQGQTFTVNANAFQSVGNPFASQIDFRTVAKTNVTESFYVWNPASAGSFGVGAFEVYARELVAPFDYRLNGTGAVLNTIESGQAFFIQSMLGGSITINEADKLAGSNNVSRTAESGRIGTTIPTLEINLMAKNSNIETFADAASINYDESLSNNIDNYDVRKISNTYDNLSVLNKATKLVVERRNKLQATDTIKINISGMRVADYKLDIKPSAISSAGLVGILKDKFLQSESVLSLDNATAVNFSVTSDAGSRAADRFMIVFKSLPTASLTTLSANRNADKTVQVNWGVYNETGITSFEVQHSNDGINFTSIKTKTPSANNGNNTTYQIIDDRATNGNNWYRVKMNDLLSAKYSAVAMVVGINESIVDTKPSFVISPNPVLDSKINCTFINKALGKYSVTVINMEGQKIYSGAINISSSNQSITITLERSVARGSYKLLLRNEKGEQETVGLMLQ